MDYFDTSVLAAYYCPEPNSPAAEKIILHSENPAISDLTELELVSALSRKIREKSITREDGRKIIAMLLNPTENDREIPLKMTGKSNSI